MNDGWQIAIGVYAAIAVIVFSCALAERDDAFEATAIGVLWLPLLLIRTIKAAWTELVEAIRS